MAEKISSFDELYLESLRDLYSAETQLVEALPKMADASQTQELKKAFEDHLEQTKGQIARLEQIFEDLEEDPSGETCAAMQGLIEEGGKLIDEVEAGAVLDAALIGAAQKVEHYEIAGYGTVRTYAEILGYEEHMEKLQETLDEEGEADDLLNEIAMTQVNEQAAENSESDSQAAAS